ncbi:hypothetical protein Cgig2_026894 [Carnegiea gigantea]|uniref:AB hydrolase-1 domain-containing protein n=1 Tax=Carnegiea gigantea TaxID=171969 RepID=A0A9Q1KWD7_9CARY|nr:hypothetical protein Cgig2_026894 [Carnegiea gigantea]
MAQVSSIGVGAACRLSPPALIRFRHSTAASASPMAENRTPAKQTAQCHPSLEVIGGGFEKFSPAFKSNLRQPYRHFPVVGSNRHVETIFAAFSRSLPDVRYRRECIRTKDDGAVALDWVAGDNLNLPPLSPVLILLPGLTGGSDDTYVRHLLIKARKLGWRVVVFNSRGCGHSPVTTPKFYSASFTGDLREVVEHVHCRYPKANVYAVGWSLGANILVRYLGEV